MPGFANSVRELYQRALKPKAMSVGSIVKSYNYSQFLSREPLILGTGLAALGVYGLMKSREDVGGPIGHNMRNPSLSNGVQFRGNHPNDRARAHTSSRGV